MHYVWFSTSVRRPFWLEIGAHVKSVTPSTIFPFTLIDGSSCRCAKWSSYKILNLSFLPESIYSKPPEASWNLESIIDNRSPRFLGSHRAESFQIRLHKMYSVDCLLTTIPKPYRELLKKIGSKYHINNFFKYPFAVTYCCYWNILNLSFTFYFKIWFVWCFFCCWKDPSPIRIVLLLLTVMIVYASHISISRGDAGCFCNGIEHPVVCKTKRRHFLTKLDLNNAFQSVFVWQLIIYFPNCKILSFFNLEWSCFQKKSFVGRRRIKWLKNHILSDIKSY